MKTYKMQQNLMRLLLAVVLLAGVSMPAWPWGQNDATCFSAYQKGPGVYHFRVLVHHHGSDKRLWAAGFYHPMTQTTGGGTIIMKRPGKPDVDLITFHSAATQAENSLTPMRYAEWTVKNGKATTSGRLVVDTLITIIGTHGQQRIFKIVNEASLESDQEGNSEALFLEWDWYAPAEFADEQNVSFVVNTLERYIDPTNGLYDIYNVKKPSTNDRTYPLLSNVSFPSKGSASELLDPQIAIDFGDGKAKPGMMMMQLISTQEKIYGFTIPGTDNMTKQDEPANVATVYIPISDTVRTNFAVKATQIFSGEKEQHFPNTKWDGEKFTPLTAEDYGQYNLYDVNSSAITVPAYHKIHNLQAEWVLNSLGLLTGEVRVSWEIFNPDAEDIQESDMFIVERASKADFSDAVQLEVFSYDKGKGLYEYIDQSDDVKRQDAQDGKFYYRVRRATSSIWTDMDAVVESGLAAVTELNYTLYIPQKDKEAEIIAYLREQPFCSDIKNIRFDWNGDNLREIVFEGSEDLSNYLAYDAHTLKFRYIADSVKTIYQPSIKNSTAVKASDWETTRKVNISAIADSVRPTYMYCDTTCYSIGTKIADRPGAPDTIEFHFINLQFSPVLMGTSLPARYWDKERTQLYLVRRMISGTDTMEVETPVPADNIQYSKHRRQYEINISDEAESPCTNYEFYFRVDASNTPFPFGGNPISEIADAESSFYFNDGMHITSLEASDRTSPDFTSLKWETVGGEFEEYEIWRRGSTAHDREWKHVTTIKAKSYLDRSAPIGIPCTYAVVGVLNCDGVLRDTSEYVHGQRDCYGSVSGYVTYTNGTVRPGTVLYVSNENIIDSVVTDENGYYYKDSLLFSEAGASYTITAKGNTNGEFVSASGAPLPLTITLGARSATVTNANILYTRCQRMEGRVLYEHSTVPVPHAHFELDGRLLKDKDGNPLETDASGNFDLMIESGVHTVRAVMDGHTFANDGYFTDENGDSLINFTGSLYGKRLYDKTRVRVLGRVTGGLTEGTKDLGFGYSTNTLGDSLTLVFELEGDNISRFVYYPTHADVTTRDTVFQHLHPGDSTTMHETPKRITVHPDPRSGEFLVELFPARYKVTQATAEGYATLFPTGMTSQAIDMSDANHIEGYLDTIYRHSDGSLDILHLPYHYRYQITYRSPIRMHYQQVVSGGPSDYLGEMKMKYENIFGTDTTINLFVRDTLRHQINYVFGYPVFNSANMRNKYTYRISATEDYYYNNEPFSARHWQEYLVNQNVSVFNGMSTKNEEIRGYIDPVTRYATVEVEVNNPSFVLTGENALRQIEFGMEVNGLYVYADPIRGYVSGKRAKGTETLQALDDELKVLDIIRDPYGANSYAYVESGTSYNAKYHTEMDLTVGLKVSMSTGPDVNRSAGAYVGTPVGGTYTGTVIFDHKTEINADFPIRGRWQSFTDAEYTFTTTQRIETSSDPLMVGAMADIYIGTMQHAYAGLVDAVCIIDSTQYRMLQPAIQAGAVHLLAMPQDSTPYYLVVAEKTELGKSRPVEFVYTQKHILEVILPRLFQQRNALLMTGTHDELQAIADSTHTSVYRTLVNETDDLYGLEKGYEWIIPQDGGNYVDDVNRYNVLVKQWVQIIAQNEKDKVEASRINSGTFGSKGLLNTYAVTSGADISYSESSSYSHASDWHWRYTSSGSGLLAGAISSLGQAAVNSDWLAVFVNYISKLISKDDSGKEKKSGISFCGYKVSFGVEPIFEYLGGPSGAGTFGNSKTAGFVLSTAADSYEDISVYRLTDDVYNSDNKGTRHDAFSDISSDQKGGEDYADFVFIRRGGATRCPYGDEETTLFYTEANQPVRLAAPTLHIDRPTISINVHEQSNVPMDQPATFVLTLSNESDITYGSSVQPGIFTIISEQGTNPNGLIITIDGESVIKGIPVALNPGESIQKTMQVMRGTAYDYDSVVLRFKSDCDRKLYQTVSFNVHYQPVSCPVSMTLPVQNWIMNTLSPHDEKGYYLPVEISGFDIHYDNFDHIDLQYKLKTQSDDQWVTQCSFYADSVLYQRASGNKAMIENGQIRNVRFYGERDPMEQQYDLRAVSYCRLGTDFITRSSDLRSGLKDTRVPQLFGVATPANGILQVGDYISIPFSEPIAANYLDEDYNFEVVGYTNQSKINRSTSLTFPEGFETHAISELNYNLSKKNFSVDLWVMPARKNQEMTYIMQGTKKTYIGFGQSYNEKTGVNRLAVHIVDGSYDGYTLSKPITINTQDWMHVVATYDYETAEVRLYLDGIEVTTHEQIDNLAACPGEYDGIGPIVLGAHPAWPDSYFVGKMLEIRLWNKVLSPEEVLATHEKQMTGYENALSAYYPLEEGRGNVAADKVGGALLHLNGLTWTRPEGGALDLKNQELQLNGEHFRINANADFTCSMWFRIMQEADSINLFNTHTVQMKLFDDHLQFTSLREGTVYRDVSLRAAGEWMDSEWHFLAVTGNHSTGVGNIYVDDKNVAQFNCHGVQGSGGDTVFIGPMTGQIDDICYWNMALPDNYLQNFYRATPNNSEMGLLVHLGFSERQLSDDGDHYSTVYNPYNERIRRDELGNIIERTEADRVILTDDNLLKGHLVDNAPVHDKGDLVKLGFNWIGKDNELVINLKTLDKEINKQNLFVTVRNVEDLAGNPQLSPLCWTLFVDRNQLRWSEKYLMAEVYQGEEEYLTVDILNQGGTTANYYIDEMPKWLSVSAERGSLSPLEQRQLRFHVSDKLDPGQYETIIYLTDDNELSEPLRIHLDVKARQPHWQVDADNTNGQTMNLFAQVQFQGARGLEYFDTDTADIVGAFLGTTCIGVDHIMMLNERGLLCMSLLGSNDASFLQAKNDHKEIRFLLWQASTGKIFALKAASDSIHLCYEPNRIVGTPNKPVILRTTDYRTQQIALRKGWNWVSFHIDPDRTGSNFADALSADYVFHTGDFIKCGSISQSYENGKWYGMPMQFYSSDIYMVRVSEAGQMGVQGTTLKDKNRHVDLAGGWNYLPFLCEQTQEINVALADYRLKAQPGDVVKGYRTFAMLDEDRQWAGSLTHLQPGEGYMLYRQDSTHAIMYYQNVEDKVYAPAQPALEAPLRYSHNMPIIATFEGAVEGDRLAAYVGNELVGEATADAEGRFLMMTSAEEGSLLSFSHYTAQGEQRTAPVLQYMPAAPAIGTMEHPYPINFVEQSVSANPDPFTDHITYMGVLNEQSNVEISLYTVGGICVFTKTLADVPAGEWQFTQTGTTGYPAGLYIATIRTGEHAAEIKLIKE